MGASGTHKDSRGERGRSKETRPIDGEGGMNRWAAEQGKETLKKREMCTSWHGSNGLNGPK